MTDPACLELAHRLADRADVISRSCFSTATIESRTKSDGSPVTDADREIEIVLRSLIRQERPDDAFIGEEFGTHGHGRRRWITDAVDDAGAGPSPGRGDGLAADVDPVGVQADQPLQRR
ncbi:inositol monophosphatase family protein [Streptomyces atratus]|uniref:inositol monophosphatase family protein n=1 Tax=Streptomyces atratus TaxID=1893 RepID=UPI001E4A1151|nr:inositol monophosphatase family protein [Streptomyces atratus]